MLSNVDEVVEVLTIFKKNVVWPKALKWNGRVYNINKVNMRHQALEGQTLVHYFSVSDSTNFFKLAFNTKNLQWKLEQVYSEG
jgi:ribosomal protein L36